MRKCAASDSAVFLVLLSAYTAKTPAPIFTISTSNDVVSHKDVPFGGPEIKILHFDPIFPQNAHFSPIIDRTEKFRVKKTLTMGMLTYSPMKVV